ERKHGRVTGLGSAFSRSTVSAMLLGEVDTPSEGTHRGAGGRDVSGAGSPQARAPSAQLPAAPRRLLQRAPFLPQRVRRKPPLHMKSGGGAAVALPKPDLRPKGPRLKGPRKEYGFLGVWGAGH